MTERVRLGTSILIMPLRNPVMLAKELATLQFLSENRIILGAGVGWNEFEYAAVGVHKSERGKRTDEMLDIMIPLLEGETRHLPRRVLLGRRPVHRAADRRSGRRSGSAAARSWPTPSRPTCRSSSSRSRRGRSRPTAGSRARPARRHDIARDWARAAGRYARGRPDPGDCLVAHENFLHLVLTNDPAKAREEQHEAFLKVMSNERGPNYLESVYLFGTPDEIVASLQARVDAGVEYFFLHTMTPDPGAAPALDRRDHPQREVPRHRRPGPPPTPRSPSACVTRRVALLGKPLKRRHSAVMHNAAFDAAGIDGRYVLLEIDEDEVAGGGRGGPRAGLARASA